MKNYIRDALRFSARLKGPRASASDQPRRFLPTDSSPAQPASATARPKGLRASASDQPRRFLPTDSFENDLRFLVAFAGDLRQRAAADHPASDLLCDLVLVEARAATALGRITRPGAHVPGFVGETGVIDDAKLTAGDAA